MMALVFHVGQVVKAHYHKARYGQQPQKPRVLHPQLSGKVDALMKADAHHAAEKAGADGYVYPFYKAAESLKRIFGFFFRNVHVHGSVLLNT